ncbi:MAG: tripartite tricarboxylate transporter substrate binding protein [Betaproteobacteria bacterium]|nr:MAG: tripartite tricarboxylate transporter substrate binding protein [Betaproteobacteria bacterium]
MLRFLMLLAAAVPALPFAAVAQDYPARPIRFIVPFPPGGGTDTVARLIAQPLAERLRQQLVIDNRGGANAIIGTDIGAKAPADGYTLVFCLPASVSVNQTLYRNLPYDPARDFTPVIQLNTIAIMLIGANALPVNSVAELVAYAKARPGQLNFASSGNGSAGHLAVELFAQTTGIRLVHVPYKGGGPALTDTISGQMHMTAGPMISALPHVKAGRVRGLAVMAPQRVRGLPDVEAMGETLPGFDASIWHGVLAPRGTPAAIVQRLNRDLNDVLRLPEIADRMARQGAETVGGTPEQFAALIKSDTAKYAKLLQAVGMAGSIKR